MNVPRLYAEIRSGRRSVLQLVDSGMVDLHAARQLRDLVNALPAEPRARVAAVATSRTGRHIHQAVTLDLGDELRAVALTYLVVDSRPLLVEVHELLPAGGAERLHVERAAA